MRKLLALVSAASALVASFGVLMACSSYEEAPSAADASADGAPAADAAPARFCPIAASVLCADFDDGSEPWGFDGPVRIGQGPNLEVTDGSAKSPPRSLRVAIGGVGVAGVTKTLAFVQGKKLAFECKLRSSAVSTQGPVTVMAIGLGSQSMFVRYAVGRPVIGYGNDNEERDASADADADVGDAADAGADAGRTNFAVLNRTINEWSRVELEYDFDKRVLVGRVDGVDSASLADGPELTPGSVWLFAGAGSYATGKSELFVDDCVATWR